MSSIKSLLRAHAEWILIGAGILLVAAVGWLLVWGVTVLAQDLGTSLATPRPQYAGDKFNLEAAGKLNLRGLKE